MREELWHSLPLGKIFDLTQSKENGLSQKEAEKRLKKFGQNKLPSEKKLPGIIIFINQLKSPLVFVLLAAAGISLFLQNNIDAVIILIAVFINTVLGFWQENKASKAITYLRRLVDFKAKVLRDGHEISISAKNLVTGDVIFLEPGDKVPADIRLIKSDNFQVDESTLTGESVPSTKNTEISDKGSVLADRENMVFNGTNIVRGKALGIIVATGIDTELGKITNLVKNEKEGNTPLQDQLSKFSHTLTYIVIILSAIIIIIGKIQGRPIFVFGQAAREGMFNIAAAIAVAAIPEGLLVSVTAILSVGMHAILKEKALIRKLVAAETLGSTSIICTDKTGTLTEGKMQVSEIITFGKNLSTSGLRYTKSSELEEQDLILKIALLCNDAVIENPDAALEESKILGTPTEAALLYASIFSGTPYEQIKKQQPRISEIPFDSEIKYMATLNKLNSKKNVVYVKGAPEKILAMSSKIRIDGKKQKLTAEKIKELKNRYEKLTKEGLRVLSFGYKQIKTGETKLEEQLTEMIFVGFVALKDPLRPETKETFKLTKKAGIRTIIITGDHKLTAKAIVSELGLNIKEKNILEGKDLDKISDQDFSKIVKNIDIYARVEPSHKLRIIKAWQAMGHVVAMTGDGVNDAPAIKAADIGIALGSGTDVAKETSDMILLDNNFKTIVSAIERGRIIFDNIKKVILYLLADSFTEIILITGALLLGLPLPLLPAQIIWINLITDGFPSIALTFEPGEKDVMKNKPRRKNERVLDKEMKLIFMVSILVDVVLLALFVGLLNFSGWEINHIRTFIFAAVGIDSLFYIFSCKSLRNSIFKMNPFSNKFLLLGIAFGLALQISAIYVPYFQTILQTVPLKFQDWLWIIVLAILRVVLIEITKYHFIIKNNKEHAK